MIIASIIIGSCTFQKYESLVCNYMMYDLNKVKKVKNQIFKSILTNTLLIILLVC